MRPTGDSVFIEPIVDEVIGRIILSEQSKNMYLPHKGIVRAIAKNAKDDGKPIEFKVGDKVFFDTHYQNYDNGLPPFKGKKITIVDAKYVLAVYA